MLIDTKNLVSISEANRNFSKVARLVDENGAAVIMKNNAPRYVLLEFSQIADAENASMDDVEQVARRVLKKNRRAFEELAK
jgi:antitoxin Phd